MRNLRIIFQNRNSVIPTRENAYHQTKLRFVLKFSFRVVDRAH